MAFVAEWLIVTFHNRIYNTFYLLSSGGRRSRLRVRAFLILAVLFV